MIKTNSKFLALPGRPEYGVQLAWGFPPRSKWTYGDQLLFHNPHSHYIFLNMRIELKYYISHKILNNHNYPVVV